MTYAYTPAGRLHYRTWARDVQAGYGYTSGDLTSVDYGDGITPGDTRSHDRRGRLSGVVRGGLTTNSFTYHDAGPVTSETQFGVVVTNRYDELLRRTNVAVVVGGTVVASTGYGYDGAGRLATVTDGTNSATYSYVANARLISQIAFAKNGTNRMTTTKSYDYLNRLTLVTNAVGAAGSESSAFAYAYNAANQRTAITNADGSRWAHAYDALGQVTNGNRYWGDGTAVLGQQFGYVFDDIGNRKTATSGGDASGTHKRTQFYTANNLNQYSQRTVPGYLDILGTATNTATVTVNAVAASRKNDYYRAELSIPNASAAAWQSISNVAVLASGTNDYVTNWTGNTFVPQTPERFTFDLDGNQTSDGRWTNKWDAENRLLSMTSHASGPSGSRLSLAFGYDSQSRRISKVVSNWTGSAWAKQNEQRFVYDGWNLVAILDTNNAVQTSFRWGTDLSGSMRGAGGVGGLISMTVHNGAWAGVYFYAYDGNGNVVALISAYDGTVVARYEYDTFGRLIRATGPLAFVNPFRFSTKFSDDESGLLYYGYRYYDPQAARWLSRDPLGTEGGVNLYCFVGNNPIAKYDHLGQFAAVNPTPHVSDSEHDNYLIFYLRCPSGSRVSDVSVDYDKNAFLHQLWLEWTQTDNPDAENNGVSEASYINDVWNDLTPGGFGNGLQSSNDYKPDVNCDGRRLEEHAYMRTRLVSNSFAAAVLRTLESLPSDTQATVNFYVAHTRMSYKCVCCTSSANN